MSLEQFAAFQRAQGAEIVRIGDAYWRRLRPFFYRPLLPFREYPPDSTRTPFGAKLGGVQYAVPRGVEANSCLNVLLFDNPEAYSLESLDRRRRWEVRQAAKHFTVCPVESSDELIRKAYSTYCAFYLRTHYGYRSERRHLDGFSRWAESLFQFPEVSVFGAYRGCNLCAVGIWALVEDALIYLTMFCDEEALRLNVTALMLHTLREVGAGCPQVKQIFVGMYHHLGRKSIDDFYLLRGCRLIQKPARFCLNPAASLFLRLCMPRQYAKLLGKIGERGTERPPIGEAPAR